MLTPLPLYHIIYHSIAAGGGMSPEALTGLLRQARSYNQGHRLTGLLLYAADNHEFVQVLEGPHAEVSSLCEHVFVLHESTAEGRMFPDWRSRPPRPRICAPLRAVFRSWTSRPTNARPAWPGTRPSSNAASWPTLLPPWPRMMSSRATAAPRPASAAPGSGGSRARRRANAGTPTPAGRGRWRPGPGRRLWQRRAAGARRGF